MSTIPASEIVSVIPSVLPTGGDALDVVGMVLTTSTRVPIGTVQQFDSPAAVASYFGPTSHQAAFAAVYFAGFTGSDVLPGSILYTQYPLAAVSAYLRGGNFGAVTLATLQSFNGTLGVTIDGAPFTASINLSAATSNSNAAELIGNALGIEGDPTATFTGAIAGTTLTVSAVGSGALAVGDVIAGVSVVSGTYITALGTGTGGDGTYTVSASQTVGSEAMTANTPGCYYDSIAQAFVINSGTTGAGSTLAFATGALATDLLLTSATSAVLSQGAAAATPAGFMTSLVAVNSDWVTFTTDVDPDGGSGNTQKQAFAAWNTLQDDSYAYVCWDTDPNPAAELPATGSLGYILAQNNNSGTSLNWEPSDQYLAAFVMGAAAAIDFEETNGRITFAGKRQAGLTAGATTATAAENLGGNPQVAGSKGNGYNYYGAYGIGDVNYTWYQRGFVTGPFGFLDSYIDQIWLNAALQNALLNLFAATKSVPFNAAGATTIEQALADPITAGLNFGAFGPGTLTASQVNALNTAAGVNAAPTLQTQGWYLSVTTPSGSVKSSRGPWQINFFYLDNGSVQSISLSSTAVIG